METQTIFRAIWFLLWNAILALWVASFLTAEVRPPKNKFYEPSCLEQAATFLRKDEAIEVVQLDGHTFSGRYLSVDLDKSLLRISTNVALSFHSSEIKEIRYWGPPKTKDYVVGTAIFAVVGALLGGAYTALDSDKKSSPVEGVGIGALGGAAFGFLGVAGLFSDETNEIPLKIKCR